MIKLSYESYVGSKSFVTPHLIIAYNSGECEVYMWAESLLKMVKMQVPFVVTTNTKLRAETEHKKITQLFGYLTSKSSYEKNPFASSKRPYRDAGKDGLIFENSYIAVYFLYEAWTDEQTIKKSLQKKKEALQNDLSDDSHNLLNSDKNIEQSLAESNPGNMNAGERNSKQKKQKKENQALNPAKENSLFDKEEDLKDTIKENDISETLDSQSNATEMSKELLDHHILDPPGQNQENDKKGDDLVDKGESGTKSEKSSTEEQRSNSENEKEESKPKSEENAEKSGNSSAGNSSSQIVSRVNEKSSSNDKSTGAKTSETSMPVADAKGKSKVKIQEQKEEMNKSKKKKNKKSRDRKKAKVEANIDELLEQGEEALNLEKVESLSVAKRKIEELDQEYRDLQSNIQGLSDDFKGLKENGKEEARKLIAEISQFKIIIEDFEKNFRESFQLFDDINSN